VRHLLGGERLSRSLLVVRHPVLKRSALPSRDWDSAGTCRDVVLEALNVVDFLLHGQLVESRRRHGYRVGHSQVPVEVK